MAPELLGQVDLAGRVVTGDALYAQKNLSRQVVEQGGDYFWVVKDNQPTTEAVPALRGMAMISLASWAVNRQLTGSSYRVPL